ncbi:sel1 repeat family protein [Erwinia sp. S63]|uniref:SEL1-like repeat protein n=1 Tax=Erwinia sp. S63 TaxID=2769341 RepID=UPI0019097533|nr:sel1 repeat family protein [Erwinia sp. S63]MBK0095724.1 sel1 repeat family protein [Erwinia sp. S63]
MKKFILLISLLLTACDQNNFSNLARKDTAVDPLNNINDRLAFTCLHEVIPQIHSDADILFKYARWLQVNNQLKQDKAIDLEIARLYRIAAENGHAKATINLQNGSLRGRFGLTASERRRFSQQLIDAGVASGYYFIAIYLQHGAAGLKQDEEMALRYYRKAADEGSALAQAYVGDKLEPVDIAPDVAKQMLLCAAEQGNGEAAVSLGVGLKINKKYSEALHAFQLGVAAGNASSARFLGNGFNGPEADDRLYYLNQHIDPERAHRYMLINDILSGYSYAHPTVTEINDIVPLPPAPLPEWDGKLKWVEAREANIPPEKPDEALIARLAKKKHLNPATGRPLPESPDFDKQSTSLLLCNSGEACPRSGYWQTAWIPDSGTGPEEVRYFREGDTMPADRITRIQSRPWPLRDRLTEEEQPVTWRYLGEA